MRLLLVILLSLFFLPTLNASLPVNSDEVIGLWKVTSVRTLGRVKGNFTGKARYWKLKDGTYRSTASGTLVSRSILGGKATRFNVKSEKWIYKNGTTEGYSYVNGEMNEVSKGTWKVNGKQIDFTETFDSLGMAVTATGYNRRINRNKWVGFAKIDPVGIRQTTTMVRIGK
jgi:hypothetical protein